MTPRPSIKILFGTETGTAEGAADDLAVALRAAGYRAEVVDMAEYETPRLSHEPLVVVITSTFGNGDPPANAEPMLTALRAERPDLSGLPFAVMGLGDASFPRFAQCGRDVDALLADLGAERVVDLVDVDGEPAGPLIDFQAALLADLATRPDLPRGAPVEAPPPPPPAQGLWAKLSSWFAGAPTPAATHPPDRRHPAKGRLLAARRLTDQASAADTWHYLLELGAPAAGLKPGDCIGVLPHNPPGLVDAILEAAQADGDAAVAVGSRRATLREALGQRCLKRIRPRLLAELGDEAAALAGTSDAMKALAETAHVLHVLRRFGTPVAPQVLVDALHPLAPRLYSVANDVGHGQVALCVTTVRYEVDGVPTDGVASTWLQEQLVPGSPIAWFPDPHPAFRLPDDDAPLIMIGTGTGIAPFRGYLEQLAHGAPPRHTWLFFGHRHAALDDLYGPELQGFLDDGHLTRLTTAWSRDFPGAYVQQRLTEHGEDVWAWLAEGARVRVCGSPAMAAGVRAALRDLAGQSGLDGEAWLAERQADGGYLEEAYD